MDDNMHPNARFHRELWDDPRLRAMTPDDRNALRELEWHVSGDTFGQYYWSTQLTVDDRTLLGNNYFDARERYGTLGMHMQTRNPDPVTALLDLAAMSMHIDPRTPRHLRFRLGGVTVDPVDGLSAASHSAELVLCAEPRTVYWRGEVIAASWERHPALWEYLVALAIESLAGRELDGGKLRERETARPGSTLRFRRANLRRLLGAEHELIARIKTQNGRQRLDLPPGRIRIFRTRVSEFLREHIPGDEYWSTLQPLMPG